MKSARLLVLSVTSALGAGALALFACGGSFDPQSKVDSVRMFASRADKPYAKPGEKVTVEVLLTDGRKDKTRPLKLYWIPVVCLNPKDDLYYACFIPPGDAGAGGSRLIPVGIAAGDGGAGDAGAAGGFGAGNNPFGSIPTGVDLGPFLPQGPTFSFTMPEDAIQPRQGSVPYGLAILFNVACAGRLELVPRDPNGGPQQVPFACTDESGTPLPPSDYVIGFTRVYSYADRTNANPAIDKVTFDGADVDLAAGITMPICTTEKLADCPEHKLDVVVPESSWELDPSATGKNGEPVREQIWVDYYSDVGQLGDDARLLYDSTKGRSTDSANKYYASKIVADGTVWAVVHDNRGGASWVTFPVHVR